MYAYLKGTLAHKGQLPGGGAYWVVDVQGVGYQVLTSTANWRQSPGVQSAITVYTSLIVREDAMQLVGFLTRDERDLFEILGTASGVGPKVALALMSDLTVSELAAAIMGMDHKRLTVAKGVGPKLAQKMVIELKDKMSQWRELSLGQQSPGDANQALPTGQAFEEAETVLLSLGYTLSEIHHGMQALQSQQPQPTHPSAEAVLQFILKWLATHPV